MKLFSPREKIITSFHFTLAVINEVVGDAVISSSPSVSLVKPASAKSVSAKSISEFFFGSPPQHLFVSKFHLSSFFSSFHQHFFSAVFISILFQQFSSALFFGIFISIFHINPQSMGAENRIRIT